MKKCKKCGQMYLIKKNNKCHKKGFCSYRCYKKTNEFKLKFKKTFIKNRKKNINIELMKISDINHLFHKLKSESVKKSQSKRIKTIKNKGKNEFSRMTKLGNKNKKINFLLNHNIIKSSNETESNINRLFSLYFNNITKHGDKVKKGIKKKYGKNISKEFKDRYKRTFLNFLHNEQKDINNLSIEEYKFFLNKFNKKHRYKDVLQWKKTHLLNQVGISRDEIEKLSKKEISQKYSQYLCDRMKLVDNIYNGYRRTKKGYYRFKNLNKQMFFRSSWEEKFLIEVDDLIFNKKIIDVLSPKFVNYIYQNLKRKYYPDFKIIFNGGFKVIEIKPLSKIKNDVNILKFKSARKAYKNNFIVLTEKEIFSDLKKVIINLIGE